MLTQHSVIFLVIFLLQYEVLIRKYNRNKRKGIEISDFKTFSLI